MLSLSGRFGPQSLFIAHLFLFHMGFFKSRDRCIRLVTEREVPFFYFFPHTPLSVLAFPLLVHLLPPEFPVVTRVNPQQSAEFPSFQ